MKRAGVFFVMIAVFGMCSVVYAGDFEDLIKQADMLVDEGTSRIVAPGNAEKFLESAELSVKALSLRPESFEASWKASRGYRLYAQQVKWEMVKDWKKLSAKYGKLGMKYGEKAMNLEPDKVDGYFWYGCNVGAYADGVSVLTALKENIKGKTQHSAETSYRMDSAYWGSCPSLCLGEFWYVLPWPMQKKKKARKYLDEYVGKAPVSMGNYYEGRLFYGRLLAGSKSRKDKAAGREMLEEVEAGPIPYYSRMASETLDKKFR